MNFSKAFRKSNRGLQKGKGWELSIRLTPKASQTKIGNIALDAASSPYLKVYVTAVPEDNKANSALLALLAAGNLQQLWNLHLPYPKDKVKWLIYLSVYILWF